MSRIALLTYSEVAVLVQRGQTDRARRWPSPSRSIIVRTKALLLANHSRRL